MNDDGTDTQVAPLLVQCCGAGHDVDENVAVDVTCKSVLLINFKVDLIKVLGGSAVLMWW